LQSTCGKNINTNENHLQLEDQYFSRLFRKSRALESLVCPSTAPKELLVRRFPHTADSPGFRWRQNKSAFAAAKPPVSGKKKKPQILRGKSCG
jgi:hypothetical protein